MRFTKALRHEQRHGLPLDLGFGIAKHLRSRLVPADDVARAVGGDDGVKGRLHQRLDFLLTMLQRGLRPLALGDIHGQGIDQPLQNNGGP